MSKVIEFSRKGASRYVKTSVRIGTYAADIFCNSKMSPAKYHFVVTRAGSAEILNWGQADTLEQAQNDAEEVIRYMTGNELRFG